MIHKMRLHNEPFELIANGTKTFELRLNDEKEKLLKLEILLSSKIELLMIE